MSTLKVSIVEGPNFPGSVTFQGAPLVIGRLGSCDLVLSDAQVSRRHASIALEDGHFVLVDLQSANGTFTGDGRTRVSRQILRDGDSIRIGYNLLRVTIRDDDATTALASASDPGATVTQLRSPVAVPTGVVLRVLSGPDRGKVFASQKNHVQIGRLSTCDVWLSDPGVSRIHATIRREPFGFAIYDENSTNGLQVGDPPRRIFFTRLEDGMVLRLSSTEVQVTISDSGCEAHAPSGVLRRSSPSLARKDSAGPD